VGSKRTGALGLFSYPGRGDYVVKKILTVLIAVFVVAVFAVPALSEDKPAPDKAPIFVTGKLVNVEGKPVVNAKVIIQQPSDKGTQTETVYSGKDGSFKGTRPIDTRQNWASISVVANGYCCSRNYYSSSDKSRSTITLYPGFKLKGKVTDENGKPLAGATVTFRNGYAYGGNKNLQIELPDDLKKVTTGKDGSFAIDHLINPDGMQNVNIEFSVIAPGRALINKFIYQKEKLTDLVVVKDPIECKLEGTFYLPGKSGVVPAGTDIQLYVKTDWGAESRGGQVGKDGKFLITQLPPGKVGIMLGSQDYIRENGNWIKPKPRDWTLPAVRDVVLLPKQTRTVELVAVQGALVKGTVIDKKTGKGVANGRLKIIHDGRPDDMFADDTTTNNNGEFEARVVGGNVTVALESIQDSQNYVYFQDQDRPTLDVKVADGEQKSDVKIEVDRTQSQEQEWQVQQKKIPTDFELKPGTYDLAWDPEADLSEAAYCYNKFGQADAAKHAVKLPEFVSKRAYVMAFQFDGTNDDGLLLVAVDESKGTNKGWDTIYADFNRNRDLTDDKPISIRTSSNYSQFKSDWFTVPSHQGSAGEARTDHSVQVKLSGWADSNYISVRPMVKGGWKGTVDSNKGKIDCINIDANFNGVFGDIEHAARNYQSFTDGDSICFDAVSYGHIVTAEWSPQHFGLFNVCKVGSKFYVISSNPTGNQITIKPYTGQLGQLFVKVENIQNVGGSATSMYVIGDAGYYQFSELSGKPLTLPVGKYRISSINLTLNTTNKLPISCNYDPVITVSAAQRTTAVIGGKISLAIKPSSGDDFTLVPGSQNTIVWDIKIGDKTTVSSIGENNGQNDGPKVKFYDKKGSLISTTTAGYT